MLAIRLRVDGLRSRDLDHRFAKVFAAQHADEGVHGAVQPVGDALAVLELALLDPVRHGSQRLAGVANHVDCSPWALVRRSRTCDGLNLAGRPQWPSGSPARCSNRGVSYPGSIPSSVGSGIPVGVLNRN